ncbi:hypothetical protein [Noviherbaspirillum aerium]|uniref:hypothetical protein n=1 Tax=Noviherbaspirillum aerium TaxID=2588497 RepID=UPI00124C70C7|nr:hypothetical protein [Noviherbaspirillum aerium]
MTWFHALPWHWFESLAMALFWMLVIVLALAPINYLRSQLDEQMQETDPFVPQSDTPAGNSSPPLSSKS